MKNGFRSFENNQVMCEKCEKKTDSLKGLGLLKAPYIFSVRPHALRCHACFLCIIIMHHYASFS